MTTTPSLNLDAILGDAGLGHLSERLQPLTQTDFAGEAVDNRTRFLAKLRALGCEKLPERQTVANAIGRAVRQGQFGEIIAQQPSLHSMSMTPLPTTTMPPPPRQLPPPPPPPPQANSISSSMYGMDLRNAERLSRRVVCVRGLNPGFFTGPGTNTYIVGTGAERVLIDAGDAGARGYVDLLQRTLRDECGGARICLILITHSHPDHIGGARSVASACGVAGSVAFGKVPWAGNDAGLPIEPVADGDVIRVDEATTLRAHFTPGHAPDHTCWSLEEEGVLFSGDTILGAGTVIIPAHGGSMSLYLESLRRLHSTQQWAAIYPGHGPPIVGAEAQRSIAAYITHREERETQILNHLTELASGGGSGGDGPGGAVPVASQTASELVGALYRDRVLSFELRQAASETVYNHLIFLREKGCVETVDGSGGGLGSRWTVRSGSAA